MDMAVRLGCPLYTMHVQNIDSTDVHTCVHVDTYNAMERLALIWEGRIDFAHHAGAAAGSREPGFQKRGNLVHRERIRAPDGSRPLVDGNLWRELGLADRNGSGRCCCCHLEWRIMEAC